VQHLSAILLKDFISIMFRTIITGTGSYIPTEIKSNSHFIKQPFYTEDSQLIKIEPEIIVEKFRKITGIAERRYAKRDLNTSDMAAIAAKKSD